MADNAYRDLIMAGAAARAAQARFSERDFAALYGEAHRAGLQAAWAVFAEALQMKKMPRLADHHPSKLAG